MQQPVCTVESKEPVNMLWRRYTATKGIPGIGRHKSMQIKKERLSPAMLSLR
jgi:hypothetical protein